MLVKLKKSPVLCGAFLLQAFSADIFERHAKQSAIFSIRIRKADNGVSIRFADGIYTCNSELAFERPITATGQGGDAENGKKNEKGFFHCALSTPYALRPWRHVPCL